MDSTEAKATRIRSLGIGLPQGERKPAFHAGGAGLPGLVEARLPPHQLMAILKTRIAQCFQAADHLFRRRRKS